jgi:predicted O-methyltransferase YrrM
MNEHELTNGRNPFLGDKDELWTARDEQSSEDEVAEFLFGLIRLIKPGFIIETGAYLGDATIAMAKALKKNDYGKIVACEILEERVKFVENRIKEEGLTEIAQVLQMEGLELAKQCKSMVEFAFIDSSPDGAVRGAEIMELLPALKSKTLIALHDTAPQHPTISKMANSLPLAKIYLNTPRGLTLFMRE